jgi:hypothetical protein
MKSMVSKSKTKIKTKTKTPKKNLPERRLVAN